MSEALFLEFTGLGEAEYAAVNRQLGIDMHTGEGDWPPGLLLHAAGSADDGTFIVTEVWSSRADQEAFMQARLGPGQAGETGDHPGPAGRLANRRRCPGRGPRAPRRRRL